jgi:hypothetical protein
MVGLMGRAIQGVGNKYIYWLYGLGTLMGGITSSLFQRPSPYIQPQVGCESVIAAYLTFLGHAQPSGLLLPVLLPSEGLGVGCHVGLLLLGLRPPEEILFRHHSWAYNLPDEKSEFFVISQSFNSL